MFCPKCGGKHSIALFILGSAQLAYMMIFGESISFRRKVVVEHLNPPETRFGLSAGHDDFVAPSEFKRPDAARMTPPPSVTEPTTNLL